MRFDQKEKIQKDFGYIEIYVPKSFSVYAIAKVSENRLSGRRIKWAIVHRFSGEIVASMFNSKKSVELFLDQFLKDNPIDNYMYIVPHKLAYESMSKDIIKSYKKLYRKGVNGK